MSESSEFDELLRLVRLGNQDAATALVKQYESLIRREVRLRLEDSRLRRALDSMDFVQSVMMSLFMRIGLGHYSFNDPSDLAKLLVAMTRNKIASAARKANSLKRDQRRTAANNEAIDLVSDGVETPSQLISLEELLQKSREMLSEEEKQLASMRTQGLSWDEISNLLGGTPLARRAQYSRAIHRVVKELGIEV